MCMVAVKDDLVKQAISYKIVSHDNSQMLLEQMFENYLLEKIKAKQRKQILELQGSGCWEGNLEKIAEKMPLKIAIC